MSEITLHKWTTNLQKANLQKALAMDWNKGKSRAVIAYLLVGALNWE